MRVACVLLQERMCLKVLAEACFCFTSMIATREEEALFLEIGSSKKLFTEATLVMRLKALSRRMELPVRVALGNSAPEALAGARFGPRRKGMFPLEAIMDFMSPFKRDDWMRGEVLKMTTLLHKLGLRKLGDVMQIPASKMESRFGRVGVLAHQRLEEPSALPWPLFIPEPKVVERVYLDEGQPCESLEPLLFILRGMIDRTMARLRGRGKLATQVMVQVEVEKNSRIQEALRTWEIDLILPQGSVRGLLPLVKEHLTLELQEYPLDASVVGVTFEVLKTVARRNVQRNFFHKRDQEQEAWNALVARLSSRLGRERTFRAIPVDRYLPEAAWKRELDDKNDRASEWSMDITIPKRPLRLLQQPKELQWVEGRLVQKRKQWKPLRWEGPERLSGEWWFKDFHRDYYSVFTHTTEQLWIFFDPQGKCFLHGYFD